MKDNVRRTEPPAPGAYFLRSSLKKNDLWNTLQPVFQRAVYGSSRVHDARADHVKLLSEEFKYLGDAKEFLGSVAFLFNVQPTDLERIEELDGVTQIFPLHAPKPDNRLIILRPQASA